MEEKLKIMIVDDNAEFVKLLTMYINAQSGMEVVGSLNDGTNVIPKLKELRPDIDALTEKINNHYLSDSKISREEFYGLERYPDFVNRTREVLMKKTEERRKEWGESTYLNIQSSILLRVIDKNWPAHIDKMTKLRDGIFFRQYANANPLNQYKSDGFNMFNQMMETISEEVVLYTLKVQVQIKQMTAEDIARMEKEKLLRGE